MVEHVTRMQGVPRVRIQAGYFSAWLHLTSLTLKVPVIIMINLPYLNIRLWKLDFKDWLFCLGVIVCIPNDI